MLKKLIINYLLKNSFDTKKVFKVFKLPKVFVYFGKLCYGTPYMYPRNHNSTIIKVFKEKRKYERNKYFMFLNKCITYGSPIVIGKVELGWKHKYDTPRFEWSPAFYIFFFNLQLFIFLNVHDSKGYISDNYWEQILWFSKYNDYDLDKSINTWPWGKYFENDNKDGENKIFISSWSNNYLNDEYKK